MVQIREISPVYSEVQPTTPEVRSCLSFRKIWFERSHWLVNGEKRNSYVRGGTFVKGEKKEYSKSLLFNPKVKSKPGVFYTGYVRRLKRYLDDRSIVYGYKREYKYNADELLSTRNAPGLDGIVFREDQLEALRVLKSEVRGVWQAPTRSGKTVLIAGLISMFAVPRFLVIVPNKTLFEQTIGDLQRFFGDVGGVGCGKKDEQDITVATIQTLARMVKEKKTWEDFAEGWGAVVVDECHHCHKFDGTYAEVLRGLQTAVIRVGFTATLPEALEGRFAMEGLLGPVLGRTEEGPLREQKVLAKPRVKIYWVPEVDRYKKLKGAYVDVYLKGICYNRKRNGLIIEKTKELIQDGLTVLVLVERLEHGEVLLKMADVVMPGVFCYLDGNTSGEVREKERLAFDAGTRRGVIATRIWSEGINVMSMGAVVNAVGGISELATIQRFGRGLGATKDKSEVVLVDFLDVNHSWFQKHSMKRLCIYFEKGWL